MQGGGTLRTTATAAAAANEGDCCLPLGGGVQGGGGTLHRDQKNMKIKEEKYTSLNYLSFCVHCSHISYDGLN